MTTTQPTANHSSPRYTNAVLTAIAGLLGLIALNQVGGSPSAAYAQPPTGNSAPQPEGDGERVSAAEQRKVIIAELRALESRIDHLDSMIARGINVKVTEMPPIQINDKSAAPEKTAKKETARADRK